MGRDPFMVEGRTETGPMCWRAGHGVPGQNVCSRNAMPTVGVCNPAGALTVSTGGELPVACWTSAAALTPLYVYQGPTIELMNARPDDAVFRHVPVLNGEQVAAPSGLQ